MNDQLVRFSGAPKPTPSDHPSGSFAHIYSLLTFDAANARHDRAGKHLHDCSPGFARSRTLSGILLRLRNRRKRRTKSAGGEGVALANCAGHGECVITRLRAGRAGMFARLRVRRALHPSLEACDQDGFDFLAGEGMARSALARSWIWRHFWGWLTRFGEAPLILLVRSSQRHRCWQVSQPLREQKEVPRCGDPRAVLLRRSLFPFSLAEASHELLEIWPGLLRARFARPLLLFAQ